MFKKFLPLFSPESTGGAAPEGGQAAPEGGQEVPASSNAEGTETDTNLEEPPAEGEDLEEKKYSKKDLEKMISDRLGRERKKHEREVAQLKDQYKDYDDLKEIDALISEFQYGATTQERKQAIKTQLKEVREEQWRSEAEEQGKDPDLYIQLKEKEEELKRKDLEIEKQKLKDAEISAKEKADKELGRQLKELKEHRGITLDMLKADPRFFDFEKTVDRSLSLLQVYDLFKKFFGPVKGAENKAEDNLGDDSGESPDEDPLDEDPLEVRINKILNARKPIEGGGSTPAQTVKTNKTFEEARAGAKKLLETMFNK